MMNLFENKGLKIGGITFLSPREALELSTSVVFIDIRPDYEISGKCLNVNEIIYLPMEELYEKYEILDSERTFIILDAVGINTRKAAEFLISNDFLCVGCLNGGIMDWERDGLPMQLDPGEMLTGSCMCTMKPKKRFHKS